MNDLDNEAYNKEMEQLERMQKNLHDRYNQEQLVVDKHDYERIVNSTLKMSPNTGESWLHFVERVKIHKDIAQEKNWKTHVSNGKKVWYTHKAIGTDCFMCEDITFISTLIQVIELMANQYPKNQF